MRLAFAGQRVHQPVRRRLADEVDGEVGGARLLEAVAGDGEDHPAVARPAHVRERGLRDAGHHTPGCVDHPFQTGHAPGARKRERNYSGNDEDEDRKQLQKRRENRPTPGMPLVDPTRFL